MKQNKKSAHVFSKNHLKKGLIGILLGLFILTFLYAAFPLTITIISPRNGSISENAPEVNLTFNEQVNLTYQWDDNGNISGCRSCDSFNATYGEYSNSSENNLSALWHFNENIGNEVYDDSGNENNGTLGGPTWVTGKFGYGLSFDGVDDYVQVPYHNSLNTSEQLTIISWIKPIGFSQGNYDAIVFKRNWEYGLFIYQGWVVLYVDSLSPNQQLFSINKVITDTWQCVAGTYDGSRLKIFIDGQEDASLSTSGTIVVSADFFRIGGWSGKFNGTIDEVALFNRALNNNEISQFCNSSLSDGRHNITIYTINSTNVADVNLTTRNFTVDTIQPYQIDLNYPSNNSVLPSSINFNWTSFDATSNISSNLTIDDIVNDTVITANGTFTNKSVHNILEGSHNWSITTWDDAGNSNNSITYFFAVDGTTPKYNVTLFNNTPLLPYDNENVKCYSYWTDIQGQELDSAIIEENATGVSQNHTVSLSGNESWANYTIDTSVLEAGTVQCRIYANDTAGNINSTPAWTFTVRDTTGPSIANITYSPSTADDLDPNITINVTANVTDFTQVNMVILQYKNASATDWTNFTMNNSSGDIYEGNFTPDVVSNWNFRIWANDSDNNINITTTTPLSVDFDWTWNRIPASFGSPNGTIGTNITLGNLTINNTGDYNLNFSLSSNREWISFNVTNTSAVNVSNGRSITFQVNATVPVDQGTYPITITIDAINASAAPDYNTTTATLLATATGPFLYVEIPTYDPSVTQGDTDVNLTAKVTNRGNDSAFNVSLTWILPSGWTNISGVLNKSTLLLGVDMANSISNIITASISSSAPTGTQTLRAVAEGVNATGDTILTGNVSVSVTVNSAAAAPSPSAPSAPSPAPRKIIEEKIVEVPGVTIIEVAPPSYSPTTVEKEKLLQSIDTLELVSGSEYTFVIKITNPFPNATLENITLEVQDPFLNLTVENVTTEGSSSEDVKKVRFKNPSTKPILKFVDLTQPAQYLEILPKSFSKIEYGETKEFTIKVTAPSFVKKGIYPLSTTITGKAVYRDYPLNISTTTGEVLSRKNITTDMIEKKTINFIVYTKTSPTYSPTPGEKEKLLQSIDALELVRGFDHTISIKITNPFKDSILQNIGLSVTGLLDEYLDVSPKSHPKIEYGETKEFKVRVSTPTYFEKGTYPLSAALTGSVFYPDYPTAISDLTGKTLSSKSFTLDMAETKTIDLIVHAVPKENALTSLQLAETSIADMDSAGFSKSRVLKFSREAKEALENGDYQRAEELGLEIQNIKETAFKTHALIQDLKEKIEDAEKRGLNVIETKNLLYLASAAFEREDYETAQQKVKDAQGLFSLETKGKVNYIKILLDYWYLALLTVLVTLIIGSVAYQNITTMMVDRRLQGLRVKELNIANLIREARIKYYAEKTMTAAMYHENIDKYGKRLVEIQQTRAKLRAKRMGTMKLPDQLKSLKKENQSLTELIKDAQEAYYNKKTMSREEYQKNIEEHKKRKAELEENIAMLEMKLTKKKRMKKR